MCYLYRIESNKATIKKGKMKKGDKVKYTKEIIFKGTIQVEATVICVIGITVLLDNGDELINF